MVLDVYYGECIFDSRVFSSMVFGRVYENLLDFCSKYLDVWLVATLRIDAPYMSWYIYCLVMKLVMKLRK